MREGIQYKSINEINRILSPHKLDNPFDFFKGLTIFKNQKYKKSYDIRIDQGWSFKWFISRSLTHLSIH